MKPRISLLVPVLNEEDNILPLYAEIDEALSGLSDPYEIVFVDDGSSDRSRELLAQLALRDPRVKAVFFRRNYGQTAAFDAGFAHASGDVIITLDSDLQNDPHDIPKMLALLDEGYDFVAGWRRKRRDGFILRTFPSRVANWIIRKVTGTRLHDLGCSLKVYRRELTDELKLYGEMHRFIGVLMEGLGARVAEYEVNHRPRVAGESKYNLIRTFKVLVDLVTVWFMQGYRTKPSYLFGGTGFLLMAGGVLTALIVLWQKYQLEVWVHRNPLFIVAVMTFIIGVQFVVLGLLAEVLVRTYFESSRSKPYLVAKSVGFAAPAKNLPDAEMPSPAAEPPSASVTVAPPPA